VALQYCTFNLAVTKNRGQWRKLLTDLNAVLNILLGTDSFPRVPKKKLIFLGPVKYVNIHIYTLFSHLTWLAQKKPWAVEKKH
jgi:hypothetical protein